MWFKKKTVLQAEGHYNTEKSADKTTDLRTTWKYYENTNSSIGSGGPSAADAGNYFYLPASGLYNSGQLSRVGVDGYYWSSSAYPSGNVSAYNLNFFSGNVSVSNGGRMFGLRVGGFE